MSILGSVETQGDINGGFHPNLPGQRAFGKIIGQKLIDTLM
jgi:hypothetical protein